MPRRRERGYVWVKRNEKSKLKIEIDGVDETSSVVEAGFTLAIIGEESNFKVRLDNNNAAYNDKYVNGETVDFYLDFSDGTTKRFRGIIEKRKKQFGSRGNVMILEGTNKYHAQLLDVTVTGEFSTYTGDAIYKSLIDDYMSPHTYTNVTSTTVIPDVVFEETPLFNAIIKICNKCGYDAYVDATGDHHFFERESIENNNEYIVQGINLISVSGLQDDLVEIKNSVKVTSEDDEGLPILYTSEDSSSQSTYGLKESVIKETSISNEDQAKALADATRKDAPVPRGKATSFFLPSAMPGDLIWIVHGQGIHSQYRIVKITHKFPQMTTSVVIAQSKDIPTFLKERKDREAGLSNLKNPYKMKWSYNFPFDDESNIDQEASNNISISDGSLKMPSGATGEMYSMAKVLPSTVTEAYLLVKGESLDGTTYKVSADDGETYDNISDKEKITFTQSGTKIKVYVKLTSTNTRINSLALLVK
ncbi:MAG: XkdQ/YqbQ family protein [Candidatus Heimdallarchaeaceae archaeon]